MRVATIDIGTNTVLLLVAETASDNRLVAVEEHATITRLGKGVDTNRRLAPDAIERTNRCLDAYADVVTRLGVDAIAVVGTSAMRDAGGGDIVREHVRTRFGVEARTISGAEEARLTFDGSLSGLTLPDDAGGARDGRVLVFDIGGGSTEVALGDRMSRAIELAHSFDVGSVRLTERHIRHDPPTNEERSAILRVVRESLAAIPSSVRGATVVGIAGTITTLAAVSMRMAVYDGARMHGSTLARAEVQRVVDELAQIPLDARRGVPGLEPKRADVIVAGGLIALAFLEHVGAEELIVSDRGVRWGLAEALVREREAGTGDERTSERTGSA